MSTASPHVPTPASPNPKPLNKNEKLKLAKDGLDCLADLRRAAAGGAPLEKDDLQVRLRWYGIYTQRPEEDGFFMLRVRVAGGQTTPTQLRKVAELADRYARGTADVTTRQNFQYHWVRLESLPTIMGELESVGLTTTEACGDTPRNITGCPLAGRDPVEVLDCTPIIQNLTKALVGKRAYSNLPRKWKTAIAGCPIRCHLPEINDQAMTAIRHPDDGRVGLIVHVGGGLSTRPHFSKTLGIFVEPADAVAVGVTLTEIFRDCGYREKRNHARVKFLMADWGPDRFREELETRLGRKFERIVEPIPPEDRRTDHIGVRPQKQPGLWYVGAPIIGGRLSSTQIRGIADLAERACSGCITLTQKQNVLVLDVPEARVAELVGGLQLLGLDPRANTFKRATIACTGTEFCKLAVVETKARAAATVAYLESRFSGDLGDLRDIFISFTGCPNSCAQYQIAEIGLLGQGRKIDGKLTDHYSIHVGGGVGRTQGFAREVGLMVSADQIHLALENLLRAYVAGRCNRSESFREWSRRCDDQTIKTAIRTGNALSHLHEFMPEPLDD